MSIQTELDRINSNVAATYEVLASAGADVPEEANTDNLPGTAASIKAVLYGTEQTLTDTEMLQARDNIGALAKSELSNAVNDALQEAKESGEFTGETGPAGAAIKSMTYDATANQWTALMTDGTSFTVDGPSIPEGFSGSWNDLTDKPSTFTPAAHTQAASTITAGTFAGQVVANSSGQTYSTSLLRNSKLVSADTNPTVNGEICWTYE